ncbi:MAG: hypothetical protein J5871_03575 [Bacteroidales bacterium]|nr:hypothetical protein [Bacteroidales bacterium]
MIWRYRITLEGKKGFFRVYQVDPACTLYKFHKQLRADLEFPVDQPILFKAFDAEGGVVARYALMDIGCGSVDKISLAQTRQKGISSFQYFYDTSARKYVIVTFEGEEEGSVASPTAIESKGPVPAAFDNGYVAFEDLPQQPRHLHDDDEGKGFDEEDAADREEEELIYDGNE